MTEANILLPYLGRWNQFRKSRFHQISERLAQDGFTVHVVQAPSLESEEVTFKTRAIDTPEGIVLHDAELSDAVWRSRYANKVIKKGYYGIGVRSQVKRLIREHDIDVLWLYNLPHYPLTTIDSVPIVFDYVDDYVAMLNSELPVLDKEPIRRAEYFAFARLLRRVDVVTAISHELKRKVEQMVGSSIPCTVIPNGVDTDVFPVDETTVPTLEGEPTVGFVGSFEYFIDFDLILDTAERMPEVSFLLVGDGREFEHVAAEKHRRGLDNVDLTGLVESDEVPGYIRRMDICLNTFKRVPVAHSAVPLKLFEYLSLKRPVISTRIREVQTIDDGYLRYADTPDELRTEIERVFQNYDAAIEEAERAQTLIRETYNWDTIGEMYSDTLQRLL